MKAAIQKLLGMAIEQDAKVKQAQDALGSAKQMVVAAERALAEAVQTAADYRQAMAVLRKPELAIANSTDSKADDKPAAARKRA